MNKQHFRFNFVKVYSNLFYVNLFMWCYATVNAQRCMLCCIHVGVKLFFRFLIDSRKVLNFINKLRSFRN